MATGVVCIGGYVRRGICVGLLPLSVGVFRSITCVCASRKSRALNSGAEVCVVYRCEVYGVFA